MGKGFAAVGATLLGVAALALAGQWLHVFASAPVCAAALRADELAVSLRLGSGYMLAHQGAAGSFDYQYDWRTKSVADADNPVRQAGAVWGLALLAAAPASLGLASAELRAGAWKGLRFFDAHAVETADGGRFPVYVSAMEPSTSGNLGTVALVALTLVELLRADDLPADERALWRAKLDSYLTFLVAARNADGLFHGQYDYASGRPMGAHSPYSDGEALLALAKAAKYLGRQDLKAVVIQAARAGYAQNIGLALAAAPDSDVTKGYYQWSSMAFAELADSPWRDEAPFGDWLLSLADWMVEVHRPLARKRNTGYAYEGLAPAYAFARARGDARAGKLACVLHEGLAHLLSWQIGHPRAAALGLADVLAAGGIQNHATEPAIRIDVVQHQLHGTLEAWDALFGPQTN